ncbi:MAG TPA: DUF4440 domain-containing protein [Flavobacteriales bacterium]|nr:DUF4440 domain-containing protein [Flavobacteriales bacterium]HNK86150.1 DUF4440 domain-containing protein [Flavobacteriales bacterium]HNM68684.1 DUF4440 domain-containing protein [Flavobacteriales bacterium]HNO05278.1 DUF4440 domain-containing protein [Flavobacteriales bacterium]
MRHGLPILVVCIASSCATPVFGPEDEAAIRAVMADQEVAWDRGDVGGFMEGYADSVCFVNARGTTCGKAAVTANYRKHYPDKAAMGDLTFSDLEVVGAGPEHAWCTGKWQLVRGVAGARSSADTLGGGFSLLWADGPSGWRIVRDHTY